MNPQPYLSPSLSRNHIALTVIICTIIIIIIIKAASIIGRALAVIHNNQYIDQSEEGVGLRIKHKDFELSRMTPPASLYEKRFMSYSQKKYRPIRRGGVVKLHQLRTRTLIQVKWHHPQVSTTNGSWVIAKRSIDQSEEEVGLNYTNEGQGLWTKSIDTTSKSLWQTVHEL